MYICVCQSQATESAFEEASPVLPIPEPGHCQIRYTHHIFMKSVCLVQHHFLNLFWSSKGISLKLITTFPVSNFSTMQLTSFLTGIVKKPLTDQKLIICPTSLQVISVVLTLSMSSECTFLTPERHCEPLTALCATC